jgi:phosphotransferase system enzyme I (PtsI)
MRSLKGTAASAGVAVGPVWILDKGPRLGERQPAANSVGEWQRAHDALEAVRKHIVALAEGCRRKNDREAAEIIAANAEILSDPELLQLIRSAISEKAQSAESAVGSAFGCYTALLAAQEDEYLQARAKDLDDLARQVTAVLSGVSAQSRYTGSAPVVVAAQSLSFGDLAQLDDAMLLGICLAEGTHNDHALILARSWGVPAVIAVDGLLEGLCDGQTVVVDGASGEVVIDPDEGTTQRCRERAAALRPAASDPKLCGRPAVTSDGAVIAVMANVSSAKTITLALEAGADGIGLLRTEFMFAAHHDLPSEEAQTTAYCSALEAFRDKDVTIRLLDLGSDKPAFGLTSTREENPALGVRGARLALEHPERVLKPQLRAILRAAQQHHARLLVPMISTPAEVRAVKRAIDQCARELGVEVGETVTIGIMIEVPAAAMLADVLATEVDFFSIGSNDLTQYLYAADRSSGLLTTLADDAEGALLRTIDRVIRAAHEQNKVVALCGEWGQHPVNLSLLVGLGIDEVSVNPASIAAAKATICAISQAEMREIAARAVVTGDTREAREDIRLALQRRGLEV